jgi:tetratricopeptide (TPR) repeat protein
MFILSVLAFLAFKLTPYGIIVAIGLWTIWLKYSISAMFETMQGKMTPPDIQSETAPGEFPMLVKQLAIIYPLAFAGYFIHRHSGAYAASAFFMLVTLVLPAILSVLAINDSLLKALNLVQAVRISLKTGTAYLMMCLFIAVIVGSTSALSMYIFQYVPEDRFVFLSVMLSNYFTLLIYHLIGYMVYQNHDKLGFETVYSKKYCPEIRTATIGFSARGLLKDVNRLIKTGQIEEAAALISDNTNIIHDNHIISERYHNLLKILGHKDKLLFYAPVYMNHLYIDDRTDKLIEVYQECNYINKNFVPDKDAALKTASELLARNKHKDALKLLEKFANTNPKDDSTAKAYIQAAEIALVNSRDNEKAKELLEVMVSVFPLHELTPYAKKKLKDISDNPHAEVSF